MANKKNGIITELTDEYEAAILNKTNTNSLEEAMSKLNKELED